MGSIGSIHVRRGSSAPSTLAAQIAAYSLDSSWADFHPAASTTGLWANSNGTGAVSNGTQIHKWEKLDGNNFSAAFTQASAGSGLFYRSSVNGLPCVEGYSDASPSTVWMSLDSTTAMNGAYTMLLKFNGIQETVAAYLTSHNSAVHATRVAVYGSIILQSNSITTNQVPGIVHSTPTSATTAEICTAMSVIGTSHNGSALNIGRRSTGSSHSGCGFRRIVIIMGTVTVAQMRVLLGLM